MRLQIKTLSQKSLEVVIEDTKTVYDLKKELSLYPDVGVKPELQKLVYAGKVLVNDERLSTYNIDVKKFLVVMVLKQPEQQPAAASATAEPSATTSKSATEPTPTAAAQKKQEEAKEKEEQKVKTEAARKAALSAATAAASGDDSLSLTSPKSKTDEMVQNIVSMGYPESEVRRALAASFNNPERAIEYLIEGIPSSPMPQDASADYMLGDNSGAPLELFRHDPVFRDLRRVFRQNPELLNDAILQIGEMYPAMLNLINENQQEFLLMLAEGDDDGDDSDESG